MERLTTEDLELKGCHGCEEKGICYARYWCSEKKKALIQLKRYEDTGLTVKQIREIDRLYAEKCREVAELQLRDTPVKVKPIGINHSIGSRVGVCPKCDAIVHDYADRFCRECGRKLEWGSWEEWEELT